MPKKYSKLIVAIGATLLAASVCAEDHRESHTHSFSKDVDTLHAALAPLWHASPGRA